MKNLFKPKNLPWLAAGLGVVGFFLRWMLYAVAVDEKGLLPLWHPLEVLLWLVTAAAVVLILVKVWKLDGSARYEDNFAPSRAAAVGHFAAAAGILLTVLFYDVKMDGALAAAWKVMGILAAPGLALAGLCRIQGKRPFFLLHLSACLFLVLHIVNHYQTWSGNPQLQDYVFTMFGAITLMLYAFYHAAFDVGSGKRRMQLSMGLLAVYLCCVALSGGEYPLLYLGGIFWAMTDLCSFTPVPKPRENPNPESE